MRRLLAVRTGRHPHEVLVCVTALLIGGSGLALNGTSISRALNETFQPQLRMAYFIGLVLSALVALYGIWKHGIEGLLIERVGMGVQACLFLAYAVAILVLNGVAGLAYALIPFCFTVANVVRAWQIGRDLKLISSWLADHPGDNP